MKHKTEVFTSVPMANEYWEGHIKESGQKMNKVWVVTTDLGFYDSWENYGETDIRLIGVFTSEEKAKQAIADEKFDIDDCAIVCVDVDKTATKDDGELEQLFYQED